MTRTAFPTVIVFAKFTHRIFIPVNFNKQFFCIATRIFMPNQSGKIVASALAGLFSIFNHIFAPCGEMAE